MGSCIYSLCRQTARFGGLVLVVLALISAASIVGRALSGLGLGPVPGDFELVEAGTAVVVFCCLPWCFMTRGHATVDLFWSAFPLPMKRVIETLSSMLMLSVWFFLTWRMAIAMQGYRESAEVSFILQMPTWWGYAASMPPAIVGCVAYAWRLLENLGLVQEPAEIIGSGAAH
jgi:TRAP-type C4-dicarboxylate transport system permease small subunit